MQFKDIKCHKTINKDKHCEILSGHPKRNVHMTYRPNHFSIERESIKSVDNY